MLCHTMHTFIHSFILDQTRKGFLPGLHTHIHTHLTFCRLTQVVEATLTIAGYINAIVSERGVTCAEAKVTQLVWRQADLQA